MLRRDGQRDGQVNKGCVASSGEKHMARPALLLTMGLLVTAGQAAPAQQSGKPVSLWASKCGVVAVAFSPDGKILATGCLDGVVILWDVATGRVRAAFDKHSDIITGVAFSLDSKTLASSSCDGTVRLWGVAGGRERDTLQGSAWGVNGVAFAPDDKTLAWANEGGTVTLWDLAARRPGGTLKPALAPLAFSPDGKALATDRGDGTVQLWDVSKGQSRASLGASAFSWVNSMTFTADGKTLATGHFSAALLWDMTIGKRRARFEGPGGRVTSAALTADGRTLAVAGQSKEGRPGQVQLWDVATGRQCRILSEASGPLAFSPDGKTLASGSGVERGSVLLWDVSRMKVGKVMK
jgi:WD40 repeat protein